MRSNKAALVDALDDLKSTLQMEDMWRTTYPDSLKYTFHQTKNSGVHHSHLDCIYVRTQCSDNCFEWKIESSGLKTDHKMVSIRFTSESAPLVGEGQWVMPIHLLYNKSLADFVNQEGMDLEDSFNILESENKWDASKNRQTAWMDFRNKLIALARKRAKVVVPKIARKINTLEAMIDATSNDPNLLEDERSLTMDRLEKPPDENDNPPQGEDDPKPTKLYETNSQNMTNMLGNYHSTIQLDPVPPDEAERARATETVLNRITVRITEQDK
ncbi:hypothetical protein BT96DRAFT_942468 [Gymnopus androsaceus JB14]|uniref:Endonuclease/exonuclease/phosphatase domain-containing protein n=1 Tax=Gymnopus androsaceus JB14 TaxID=1447944 RepID=A0A6A4HDP4_9AGAR|nr:hypothetical protein BT96DRAFT_942468 [Gymnopus androsaceus JB14]